MNARDIRGDTDIKSRVSGRAEVGKVKRGKFSWRNHESGQGPWQHHE